MYMVRKHPEKSLRKSESSPPGAERKRKHMASTLSSLGDKILGTAAKLSFLDHRRV